MRRQPRAGASGANSDIIEYICQLYGVDGNAIQIHINPILGGCSMFRGRRSLFAVPLLIVLVISTGCSRKQPTASSVPTTFPQPTATAATSGAATATPASGASSIPLTGNTTQLLGDSCILITSNDLAHLFPPHNEIMRNPPKIGPVSHPPFSDTPAAGTETECLFYDFHQPGKVVGWMLQVTYLFDVPDPSAVQAWGQAWEAAKAKSGQPVSGLGDDAFANGANLFVKIGDTYISFESADTQVDEKTAAGAQQLLTYEKQLAEAGLSRLK
jgi:hypothetical protein